jgi:hypothetical protein
VADQEYAVDCATGQTQVRPLSAQAAADLHTQQAADQALNDQQQATEQARALQIRTTLVAFMQNASPTGAETVAALRAAIRVLAHDLN